MASQDNVKEFYEYDSNRYDTRWIAPGGAETARRQLTIVEELSRAWKDKDIVEIGCGSGRFSTHIHSLARKAYFLDLTMGMLLETRNKFTPTEKHFNGVNGSAYQIPFPAESVDCILSINVFNHIPNIQQALLEINRILKPGGILVLNFTNLMSFYIAPAILVNRKEKSIGRDVYTRWLTPDQINRALTQAGFKIETYVGNVFVPKYLEITFIRDFLLFVDPMFRNSVFKRYAPTIFFKCEKVK
jgi:ubiquinone/menaquinone biosynthesis C-methylase UbiE